MYNQKPEEDVMNYSIAIVDFRIISPIEKPHTTRDYVLTCLVLEEPEEPLKKIYSKEIRLTRQEVERLKEKRSELERKLDQLFPIALEDMQQKSEIERKLNTLNQNLRTIDNYLKSFGE